MGCRLQFYHVSVSHEELLYSLNILEIHLFRGEIMCFFISMYSLGHNVMQLIALQKRDYSLF